MGRYVVFGGSSGIGQAVAERLCAHGHQVAAVSNDAAALAALPPPICSLIGDVTQGSEVESVVADAVERLGGLDGMVYSAGIQRYGSVVSTQPADWDQVIAVNLRGAYLAARSVMAHLIRSRGSIVNVSSVQARACQAGVAAYAASKGGMNALTRAIALDHASDGVRANVVCPGSVDTPMLRASAGLFMGKQSSDAVMAEWGQSHALGRVAEADEVAAVVEFLLSEGAAFVTGAEIVVDGGLTAALAVKVDGR